MVRRTRKRSKNKKGGADTSFTGKFLQGANDIGDRLKDASIKAKETYKIGQQGIKDFNEAAEAEGRRLAQGGDGENISLFEKKNPQALLKPRRPVFPKPVTPTIIGRGGKRKTRRKKRRKNKKRKTKKRRRKRKTKKRRRR